VTERDSDVAVALLYDTRERGAHLRDALEALGTSIVYEAATHSLDRSALERSQANVVVVNLDAQPDPDLDDVYALLADTQCRVIFNDSEVSSALSGWDQARWARHLVAKIRGGADIDPPRPADAEAVPMRAPSMSPGIESQHIELQHDAVAIAAPAEAEPEPSFDAHAAPAISEPELDLASDWHVDLDAPAPAASHAAHAFGEIELHDEPVSALDLDDLIDLLPATHDGSAHSPMDHLDASALGEHGLAEQGLEEPAPRSQAPAETDELAPFDLDEIEDLLSTFDNAPSARIVEEERVAAIEASDLDELSAKSAEGGKLPAFDFDAASAFTLQSIDDEDAPAAEAAPIRSETPAPIPSSIAVPSQWSLEDIIDDLDEGPAPPNAPSAPGAAAVFGIEKLSAEEFLAPPTEEGQPPASDLAFSDLSLELIPLEEAVAPTQAQSVAHENWLDPSAAATNLKVRRVWVLGASIGGPESVREFLAEFPRSYPALFVLAQHLGGEFVDMMTRQLAKATPLTIRTPTHGERVGHGEVVIVPTAHRLLIDPEGVVVLERLAEESAYSPSIDQVLRDVADRFGAGAGAIVFSGMSNDAVEGSQYLAQKGGRVYAQNPESCVVSTMVDGVREAGVVGFVGTPKELAEKLLAEAR